MSDLQKIHDRVARCRRCPELRAYCRQIARDKRRAFAGEAYWGRPVPGFGDPRARIWIVGLAPAAHGANRTGRMFTGDRSGDFLYAALHRAGLASRARAESRDDGMTLTGVYISSAARCAPPANKPAASQLQRCSSYLDDELQALTGVRLILALGGIAWDTALRLLVRRGVAIPRPRPRFAHGAEITAPVTLLGSYHVSQQFFFAGRLTEAMLDRILTRARTVAGISRRPDRRGRRSEARSRPRPEPRDAGDPRG